MKKLKQIGQLYGTEREPNPQAGRIYDASGISPTLDTCQGGCRMPKIMVKNATKNGGVEIKSGGGDEYSVSRQHDKKGARYRWR